MSLYHNPRIPSPERTPGIDTGSAPTGPAPSPLDVMRRTLEEISVSCGHPAGGWFAGCTACAARVALALLPQGGPARGIEQAAREYVQANRDLIAAKTLGTAVRDRINLEEGEDAAWTNLCVAVDGWKPGVEGEPPPEAGSGRSAPGEPGPQDLRYEIVLTKIWEAAAGVYWAASTPALESAAQRIMTLAAHPFTEDAQDTTGIDLGDLKQRQALQPAAPKAESSTPRGEAEGSSSLPPKSGEPGEAPREWKLRGYRYLNLTQVGASGPSIPIGQEVKVREVLPGKDPEEDIQLLQAMCRDERAAREAAEARVRELEGAVADYLDHGNHRGLVNALRREAPASPRAAPSCPRSGCRIPGPHDHHPAPTLDGGAEEGRT